MLPHQSRGNAAAITARPTNQLDTRRLDARLWSGCNHRSTQPGIGAAGHQILHGDVHKLRQNQSQTDDQRHFHYPSRKRPPEHSLVQQKNQMAAIENRDHGFIKPIIILRKIINCRICRKPEREASATCWEMPTGPSNSLTGRRPVMTCSQATEDHAGDLNLCSKRRCLRPRSGHRQLPGAMMPA